MTSPPELVIFDCDGVLVDSERIAVRLDAEVMAELGWSLSEEEIVERFLGRSQDLLFDDLAAHATRPLPEGWRAAFQRRYLDALDAELKPVDGIVDVLDVLDALRVPTCVASSGSHEKMRRTLGRTGLHDRFDGRIFSADEVAQGKPAPDLFLYAAERMGVAPAACAVVEDSKYGVQAARSAGMSAFGFAGGLTPRDWLAGPGTVVFDDMRDLPRLLGVD
ncbi:MAG TPA: HAD family phosphatase [Streptosporangiales bacterium]